MAFFSQFLWQYYTISLLSYGRISAVVTPEPSKFSKLMLKGENQLLADSVDDMEKTMELVVYKKRFVPKQVKF